MAACTWASMSPGIRVRPSASMTSTASPATSVAPSSATSTIRSPSTRTDASGRTSPATGSSSAAWVMTNALMGHPPFMAVGAPWGPGGITVTV